jgi:hypothetical protein
MALPNPFKPKKQVGDGDKKTISTVGEIRDAVSKFRANTDYSANKRRWDRDFELYRLKPYHAGSGYYSYTSDTGRIVADKTIGLLAEANLIIHIPEDVLQEEDRRTADNVERLLYGVQVVNDEKSLYIPHKPTNRQLKAWYATVRGSFAERVYVHKEDGETLPEISVWDIYNVAYAWDSKGLVWAAHFYQMPAEQAAKEYGISRAGSSSITAIDFWDREKNVFIIGTDEISRFNHNLDYCPVFIFHVGATPIVFQDTEPNPQQYAGESVYAPIREILPILNKTMSDALTLVRRGVKVPLVEWTADGESRIDKDIYQVEKAAILTYKVGEPKPEPLLTQSMPADTQPLLALIMGEIQRGTYSHTSYGELGFRLSGYAISQLQQALATVITPFTTCLEQSYLVECLEILKQYGGKDWKPLKVKGRTSRNLPFGYPKPQEIKPSDVEGTWHPEVRLEPVLPKDEPQRAELARMWREGEFPILSDDTIRTEFAGVRDSGLEKEKINREWADKQLIQRMYDAYIAYVSDGQIDKAMNQLAALRLAMSQMGGAPQTGLPAGGAGFTSSTMPLETMGGTPPGAVNAGAMPTEEMM